VTLEAFRNHCLAKPGVAEEFPFGEDTLVYKVGGKMFALTNVDTFESLNLKCEPARAIELREQYESVQPGYHMNKKHWNTVLLDGSLPDVLVMRWIDDSFDLVVASLPQVLQRKLLNH